MKQPSTIKSHRIAMLIDGDNAQAALIEKMLVETAKYGVAGIRRIYGDWTEPQMNQWKQALNSYAIQPVQQFRYTVGKNVTDSALIIDAMDILHSGRVDRFCIVSSDSDYTRLATRIREEGMFVIGMGKQTTPNPFVVACDVFVYVENLAIDTEEPASTSTKTVSPKTKTDSEAQQSKPSPTRLLLEAYQVAAQEDGWALLSTMGSVLRQLRPDFDPRTYGYKSLSLLFRAQQKKFEMDESGRHVRLRDA